MTVSPWLHWLACFSLVLAVFCAALLTIDVIRRPQKMAVMNFVWPVTALYLGPLALWLYARYARAESKPFWATVALGVTHCGAGCTLGDILAESTVFVSGVIIFQSSLATTLLADYAAAYLLGVAFQYFSIAPMRGISGIQGVWAAIKADTLSLTAFEVGLFAWMWFIDRQTHGALRPDSAVYWLSMQFGMALGFLTAYPMNWWLIRRGIKEAM